MFFKKCAFIWVMAMVVALSASAAFAHNEYAKAKKIGINLNKVNPSCQAALVDQNTENANAYLMEFWSSVKYMANSKNPYKPAIELMKQENPYQHIHGIEWLHDIYDSNSSSAQLKKALSAMQEFLNTKSVTAYVNTDESLSNSINYLKTRFSSLLMWYCYVNFDIGLSNQDIQQIKNFCKLRK